MQRIAAILLGQRGTLFPWAPVFLGCGIGWYFALWWEPAPWVLLAAGTGAAGAALLALRWGPALAPLAWAVALVAGGFALAGARAHWVAGPQIDWRYYGPVEGRVIAIDRSASGAQRLTLDRVVLSRVAPDETPRRVRVALHGDGGVSPEPGLTVLMTAHLSVSAGPVEPGGFDFRRHAWFQKLGAVGYTRHPLLGLEPPDRSLVIFRARMALSERIRTHLPGQTGAFAAAILTGDRSGLNPPMLEALRASNLAHLLAISGLHMGLLAGFVFAALRLLLLLVFRARFGRFLKKAAAAGALVAAFVYLLLSGGNVATERAFVMVAVALLAVMADRRALSLRAVALAALIVLTLRPEALLGPGFQMSFAATTALVAAFGALRGAEPKGRIGRGALALLVSSAVAGAATAPVAMAHFNMVAHYGLVANLLSVPLMGVFVMPAGVIAVLAMPFGLEAFPLGVMGLGLRWIETVAETVSRLPGAVGHVASPPAMALPVLALGGLVMILWQGRARWAGAPVMLLAALVWSQGQRPDVLISPDGALVGVMTETGRALSKPRGQGFVASIWLENDGDAASQAQAADRWPGQGAVRVAALGRLELVHLQGKTGARALAECTKDQIVVANEPVALKGCTVFDAQSLRDSGGVALYMGRQGMRVDSVAGRGWRVWHGR